MSGAFSSEISTYGEHGWIARLTGARDIVAAALFVNTVADAVRGQTGIIDAVAGVDSLVIRFNPELLTPSIARAMLEQALAATPSNVCPARKQITIPVCYGGAHGPDLGAVSKKAGLTPEQVIKTHAEQPYRVLAVGFAPGFAYLGPLSPSLHVARRATPRPRVDAGSVGVAGAMTGVYPLASPGGWQIIGRTPTLLFNPSADDPFTFAPGDEVRFRAIGEAAFHALVENAL